MPHSLSSPPDLYASTGFTRFIKEYNSWDTDQFSRWVFSPGMLFNAGDKWWGDFKARPIPHEGIDLGLYVNGNGCLTALAPSTHIPAMYNGRIVKIMDDYLGKTIVMEHAPVNESGRMFLTLYGHTRPMEHLSVHQNIKQGEVICSISSPSKSRILPHLHISLAEILSPRLSYVSLDWHMIPKTDMLSLIDPVPALDGPFDVQPEIALLHS